MAARKDVVQRHGETTAARARRLVDDYGRDPG